MTALADKTVIFVTHQVEFLPSADMILVWPYFVLHIYAIKDLDDVYISFQVFLFFCLSTLCIPCMIRGWNCSLLFHFDAFFLSPHILVGFFIFSFYIESGLS